MADKKRCKWCESNELDLDYHDKEWGVPVYEDQKLFELLILEGAQAGVSWHVVLQKRAHYKKIFADFDIEKCAKLTAFVDVSLTHPQHVDFSIIVVFQQFRLLVNFLWRFAFHIFAVRVPFLGHFSKSFAHFAFGNARSECL